MGGSASRDDGTYDPLPAGASLRCVAIFFRHGPRTPLTHLRGLDDVCYNPTHPTALPADMDVPTMVVGLDGVQPVAPSPAQLLPGGGGGLVVAGMLTPLGRKRSFEFGRGLRAKYMVRLGMDPNNFDPRDIYLRAKNLQRTVDTLRCVVSGMFSKQAFQQQQQQQQQQWTVALIKVARVDDDILNTNSFSTSHRALAPKLLATSPGYVQLIHVIRQETGDVTITPDRFEIQKLNDEIEAATESGLPVPGWASRVEKEVRACWRPWFHVSYGLSSETGERSLAAIAGPLLGEVRRCLRSKVEDPSQPKMFLFCCSDTTLYPLLLALGQPDVDQPPFLADLAFEVYSVPKSETGFSVRLVYRGRPLIVPGQSSSLIPCHEFCRIVDSFVSQPVGQFVSKIIVKKYG